MQLRIDRQGQMACVYGEAIDLAALGQLTIRRGSHVEPDRSGRWWADLGPVSGPRLGPFSQRSEALTTERTWLETHWLPNPLAWPSATTARNNERIPRPDDRDRVVPPSFLS
jgi:hypothetical protein